MNDAMNDAMNGPQRVSWSGLDRCNGHRARLLHFTKTHGHPPARLLAVSPRKLALADPAQMAPAGGPRTALLQALAVGPWQARRSPDCRS
jgi:hypothetical protein